MAGEPSASNTRTARSATTGAAGAVAGPFVADGASGRVVLTARPPVARPRARTMVVPRRHRPGRGVARGRGQRPGTTRSFVRPGTEVPPGAAFRPRRGPGRGASVVVTAPRTTEEP